MAADNIRNVEDYFPFIIETVSEVTGRYVETENSIELSIAMEKFIEADRSYDEEKGSFMTYLKVLIRNGVIDYLRKQNKTIVDSDIVNDRIGNESGVHEKAQLLRYEKLLRKYSVSFESLAVKGPKHKETRLRMVRLAKEMTKDNTVIHHLKRKETSSNNLHQQKL